MVQDLLFALRQLSDIALRALSSAINDPSTAINCIDALATVIAELLEAQPSSAYRCDEKGVLRVIAPPVSIDEAFEEAFGQIRRYGANDVTIVLRLLELCSEFEARSRQRELHDTLRRFVQELTESAAVQIKGASDQRRVNDALVSLANRL
jgi:uncharacterized membrane protein